jgi:hypothetical protein
MSDTKLRQLQIGQEATPGTPATCTAVYRGPASTIHDPTELIIPPEDVGYKMQVDRGYFASTLARYDAPETELTFEQVLYPLEAGIKTVSPSANGGTSTAYIYTHPLLSTAGGFVKVASSLNPVKTMTLKGGNNQQAYAAEFCFVEEWTLSGAPGEALKHSHKWVGRQRTKTTFDSVGLTMPEPVYFQKGKLFMDDSGGTIGTTQKAATWLGFSATIKTGWAAQFTGDGDMYFTFIKCGDPTLTGSLTLMYDDAGEAAEDKYAAATTQLMRWLFAGSALPGAGGTHTTKLFRLDQAVKIKSIEPLDGQDGRDVLTFNWEAVQGNAGQLTPTFTTVNLLAAVP